MTSSAANGAIRLAVIDADSGFVQVLTKRLEGLDWQHRVSPGPIPVDALVAMRLNALVVDLSVAGPKAWEYLETVCSSIPGLGVIVCTGGTSVAQRVRGLRMGADDWMTKPCHPEELIARVEAVVRRRRRADPRGEASHVQVGELLIRSDQYQAFVGDSSAGLTRREFELLELLAAADGQVLPREDIYQRIWGYAMAHGDRSVDVFIRKVRLKLEAVSPDWRYVHTHFGVGYRLEGERIAASAAPVDRDESWADESADQAGAATPVAA